jgi:plastocyanin/sugar lactone lactonase YvrE
MVAMSLASLASLSWTASDGDRTLHGAAPASRALTPADAPRSIARVSRLALTGLAAATLAAIVAGQAAAAPTTVTVYGTGLFNPKGMAFGPDGTLYVAESGPPGTVKVPLPVNFGGSGPIGTRGRVSSLPPGGGAARPFATGLPNIGLYGGVEMLGPASVTMFKGQLYEVAAGHMTVSPKLSRMTADGKLVTVADVGKFNDDHPPPEDNGDAVPMGNPYDMVAAGDHIYISDGNYNSIIEATPATGKLRLLKYFRPIPTVGLAVGPDGDIYVARYGNAPYLPGSGRIDKITPGGKVTEGVVKGLTTPIDVAFARDGTMYVLQYAARFNADKLRYVENTGGLFRIGKDGSKQPLVTRMMFPTALEFGKDGALYSTNFGNEANHGEGQVLKIVPGTTTVVSPKVPPPKVHGSYDVPKSNQTFAGGNVAGAAKLTIVEPTDYLKWGYEPKTLKVKAGQKIVITNQGRIAHTATSVTGAFDTGLIKHNRSAVVKVDKPGTYKFICTPHPWMKGTLIVTGSAQGGGGAKQVAPAPTVKSPSLNKGAVIGVVGVIIAGIFGLAWLARRRPEAA